MFEWAPQWGKKRSSWAVSALLSGLLTFAIVLVDSRSANALPLSTVQVRALPAFARKYGMPCSACHLGWPMLSPFGQAFKDNGYQMGSDRDAPIFQQPAYWPVTFRITPIWHRDSQNRVGVDDPANPGGSMESRITTTGFDWTGLDFHAAGTLAKNISFYVLPSSDNTGAFHFESVWGRLDNLFGSSWFNVKMGKFELDNLLSEKRILTLTSVAGTYANYHFQPLATPGSATNPLIAESYTFGIGDNQVGVEVMGHSKDDRTRYSASLLSSNDGSPGLPTSRGYDAFFTASRAFQLGSLGLQRIGAFAYIGQAPTYFQYSQTTTTQVGVDSAGAPVTQTTTGGVPGTGIGNKTFYRAGLIGQIYIKKYDLTAMYFHSADDAFLGTGTAANTPLPTGAQKPIWNGGLFESHYMFNPQFILINRYELVRMSQQALPVVAGVPFTPGVSVPSSSFGNMDVLTFGWRYYPFISSRAGFAFHNEYAISRQRGTSPINGLDLITSSLLVGFDFAF